MSSAAIEQAKKIVDGLNLAERVRLLQYIAPKIDVESAQQQGGVEADAAWEAFREVGRRIAKLPADGVSITQAVSDMRR